MGAMMRISNYTHPDVFIEKGDTVIFSSKIIPGNEKKLYKLHNQLVREGIEVISEDNEFVQERISEWSPFNCIFVTRTMGRGRINGK